MSAPVRDNSARGPLLYAPKWARRGEAGVRAAADVQKVAPGAAPPASPPSPASGVSDLQPSAPPPTPRNGPPPAPRTRPHRQAAAPSFKGDIAIKELRSRLALAPDAGPQPPSPLRRRSIAPMAGRLCFVAAIGCCGAYVFVALTSSPKAVSQPQAMHAAAASKPNPLPIRYPNKGDRVPRLTAAAAPFSAADYAREVSDGLGAPVVTAIPPEESAVQPPLLPVDTRIVPPAAPASPGADDAASTVSGVAHGGLAQDEVAALVARGRDSLAAGDISAARIVLRRAAEAGDSQAALALGGTYDPNVLRRLGVVGFAADLAQARTWYRKAAELGSTDAPRRLDQLAQTERLR